MAETSYITWPPGAHSEVAEMETAAGDIDFVPSIRLHYPRGNTHSQHLNCVSFQLCINDTLKISSCQIPKDERQAHKKTNSKKDGQMDGQVGRQPYRQENKQGANQTY